MTPWQTPAVPSHWQFKLPVSEPCSLEGKLKLTRNHPSHISDSVMMPESDSLNHRLGDWHSESVMGIISHDHWHGESFRLMIIRTRRMPHCGTQAL